MPEETISVIGNHRAVNAVKTFLQAFGFEIEQGPAHFAVEILKSKKQRILHKGQEELAGFLRSFLSEFGVR